MSNEIIPYLEMCRRERVSLQRGMNFQMGDNHSVILISVRIPSMQAVSMTTASRFADNNRGNPLT